jgi:hypothetical protein
MHVRAQSDAQVGYLHNDLNNLIDAYYLKHPSIRFHSGMRPYLLFPSKQADDTAFHIYNYKIKNYFLYNDIRSKPQYRNRFAAQFLPQVNAEAGFDMLQNKFVSETSGGMYSRLDINDDFSADITFVGGQVSYPNFTDTIVSEYKIIPGLGTAYGSNGKYNFTNLTGHISYSPIRILNFQLGKDKMFIGEGYRSLLLSDIANNYPYFKSTVNIWTLQYSVWYSAMKDIYQTNGVQKDFRNKYATSHYLSFNPSPEFNISFFETEVFQGTDTNRHRGFDPNYLNPIIFYRPVEYSIGSSDNALMGLNMSVRFLQRCKLYGQLVLDEFNFAEMRHGHQWWGNKQGWQFGFKSYDVFGIRNLGLQLEFNQVRPFTYSHGSPQQNYAHFNQPLAHPFGANFAEGMAMISYKHKRWQLDFKGIVATIGKDTTSNTFSVGQNIFLSYTKRASEYGQGLQQGNQMHFMQGEIKFSYFVIPGLNMRLEAGIIQCYMHGDLGYINETPYVYLGIRTAMYNFYRDF